MFITFQMAGPSVVTLAQGAVCSDADPIPSSSTSGIHADESYQMDEPTPGSGSRDTASGCDPDVLPLPYGWAGRMNKGTFLPGLRSQDQKWVSRLFEWRTVGKNRSAALRETCLKFWHEAPQPRGTYNQMPTPDDFFRQGLFLWAPYRIWSYHFTCTNDVCGRQGSEKVEYGLTACGFSRSIKEVIDLDRCYYLAWEILECKGCKKRYSTTDLLDQLPYEKQIEFRIVQSNVYACDQRVVMLMRDSGTSASSTRRTLEEAHCQRYAGRTLQYLSAVEPFLKKGKSQRLLQVHPKPPHPMPKLPGEAFLADLYVKDVTARLHTELLPALTSIGGQYLKVDSTKKVLKKLGGAARGSAAWVTNVGNELGQIVISVVTEGEDYQYLRRAFVGIITRYAKHDWTPCKLLYADRWCCRKDGSTFYHDLFKPSGDGLDTLLDESTKKAWESMTVRLDSWHWMSRFDEGLNTTAHPKYELFMSRLPCCLFDYNQDDLALLRAAVLNELVQATKVDKHKLEDIVDSTITKRDLQRHVRRSTVGVAETLRRVNQLLETFTGDGGLDLLGNSLFSDGMPAVWSRLASHVPCLQDPETESLYEVMGTQMKGGVELNVYRCFRGSSSLENAHLHMNKSLAGRSYNSESFMAHHVQFLVRFNESQARRHVSHSPAERGHNPKKHTPGKVRGYDRSLMDRVEHMHRKVFGRALDAEWASVPPYTGESVSIDYLRRQTSVQDAAEDPTEWELDEVTEADEGFEEDMTPDPEPDLSFIDELINEPSTDNDGIEGMEVIDAVARVLVQKVTAGIRIFSKDTLATLHDLASKMSAFDKELHASNVMRRTTPEDVRSFSQLPQRFKKPKSKYGSNIPLHVTKVMFFAGNMPDKPPTHTRVMKRVIDELLLTFTSPVKGAAGHRESVGLQVERAYKQIRKALETSDKKLAELIPLYPCGQWRIMAYKKREDKKTERRLMRQGLELPSRFPVSQASGAPPRTATKQRPQPSGVVLQHDDPEDMTGKGKACRSLLFSSPPRPTMASAPGLVPVQMRTEAPGQLQLCPTLSPLVVASASPGLQSPTGPVTLVLQPSSRPVFAHSSRQSPSVLARTTAWYAKKKAEKNESIRKLHCKICLEQIPSSNHPTIGNYRYCPKNEEKETYEAWASRIRPKFEEQQAQRSAKRAARRSAPP